MQKKKKKFSLLGAFSKIGGGVVKTGEAAKRLGAAVKVKAPEKGDEVSKRLAEIKRLETLREEDLREERKLMEEEGWGERAEIEKKLREKKAGGERAELRRKLREEKTGDEREELRRKLREEKTGGKRAELEKKLRDAEMKMRADEKAWEARAELKRPLSERLSEVFYGFLKKPAQRLVGSLKGVSTDLYRANLSITPEKFAALLIGLSLSVTIFAAVFLLLLGASLILVPLVALMAFAFTFMLGKSYPKRKAKGRTTAVNRLIPYALRHMATQLSSGIGLPETMTSVSNAGYGALSEEFGMAIQDMNTGMSLEEALTEMDERVNSEPLRRALRQIQRTLRIGGDLSHTLNTLADETAFEMRAKLRDYVQSLNLFTLIYMFMSAVIPAMLMVVIMISGSRGGGGITPSTAGVLYLILLPFMLVYFVIMIKRFEPRL